jgi:hypothetical protein
LAHAVPLIDADMFPIAILLLFVFLQPGTVSSNVNEITERAIARLQESFIDNEEILKFRKGYFRAFNGLSFPLLDRDKELSSFYFFFAFLAFLGSGVLRAFFIRSSNPRSVLTLSSGWGRGLGHTIHHLLIPLFLLCGNCDVVADIVTQGQVNISAKAVSILVYEVNQGTKILY